MPRSNFPRLWNAIPAVGHWDPLRELHRLQGDLSRIYRDFAGRSESHFPPVRVWTGEEGARLAALVPGFDKEQIDISITGDTLTLKGSRESALPAEGETWHRRERGAHSFTRTFQLPFNIEAAQVKASFKDGVLQINLPRLAADKPRKIEITAG